MHEVSSRGTASRSDMDAPTRVFLRDIDVKDRRLSVFLVFDHSERLTASLVASRRVAERVLLSLIRREAVRPSSKLNPQRRKRKGNAQGFLRERPTRITLENDDRSATIERKSTFDPRRVFLRLALSDLAQPQPFPRFALFVRLLAFTLSFFRDRFAFDIEITGRVIVMLALIRFVFRVFVAIRIAMIRDTFVEGELGKCSECPESEGPRARELTSVSPRAIALRRRSRKRWEDQLEPGVVELDMVED